MREEFQCGDCGVQFERRHHNIKCCDDCRGERRNAAKRRYNHKIRGGPPPNECDGCGCSVTNTKPGAPRRFCDNCRPIHYWAMKCEDSRASKKRNAKRVAATKRRYNLRRMGLTESDYDSLLAAQGGRCAICRTDDPGGRNWHIDHDHSCCGDGQACERCVRGLLCTRCNSGIGMLRENVAVLGAAIDYLNRYKISK